MVGKPVYVTREGLAALQAELDELIGVRRPALALRLHDAIKQGDLSENADYITAKEELGFVEGRVIELQEAVHGAVLISDSPEDDGRVHLGSHVTVVEVGYDDEETYHLVGPTEADPAKGRISHESPLGQALLGKTVGATVAIEAPAGKLRFRVTAIS